MKCMLKRFDSSVLFAPQGSFLGPLLFTSLPHEINSWQHILHVLDCPFAPGPWVQLWFVVLPPTPATWGFHRLLKPTSGVCPPCSWLWWRWSTMKAADGPVCAGLLSFTTEKGRILSFLTWLEIQRLRRIFGKHSISSFQTYQPW